MNSAQEQFLNLKTLPARMKVEEVAWYRHSQRHPLEAAAPTLPLYSSHGAWSKAIGEARKWLDVLETDPVAFERRVLG